MADATPEGKDPNAPKRETLRISLPPRPLRPATGKITPTPRPQVSAATTLPMHSSSQLEPAPASTVPPAWSTAVTKPMPTISKSPTPPPPPSGDAPEVKPVAPPLTGAPPTAKTTPLFPPRPPSGKVIVTGPVAARPPAPPLVPPAPAAATPSAPPRPVPPVSEPNPPANCGPRPGVSSLHLRASSWRIRPRRFSSRASAWIHPKESSRFLSSPGLRPCRRRKPWRELPGQRLCLGRSPPPRCRLRRLFPRRFLRP